MQVLSEAGLTLIELMVVVVILAITAMIAVPNLTRDRLESRFRNYVKVFASDVRRSHYEAMSTKDHHQFVVSSQKYRVETVVVSTTAVTPSNMLEREVPPDVEITGVLPISAVPGKSYTAPTSMSGSETFRLEATGGLSVEQSSNSFAASPVTVFFKTTHGGYKARVVIYMTTCQTHVYDDWGGSGSAMIALAGLP